MTTLRTRQIAFVVPGDIATATGGYAYDRRVLELLPDYGVTPRLVSLPASYPTPSAEDLKASVAALTEVPHGTALLIDGLALGAMPPETLAQIKHSILALVHHPLCLEAGLSAARAAELKAFETAALARAKHVIVTSFATKRILVADFGVPATKITVAEPGTDPAQRASGTGTPLQLLSVGAVSPRKGYDILVKALEPLAIFDWRLTIAGATDRNPAATAKLEDAILQAKLTGRVRLSGTVVPATLQRYYDSADLFVLPSLFEGYGMVLAEAMARGLPIVCTTGGASADTVPNDAAIKVPPGDVSALSQGLERAITNKKARARLADASWEMGRTLPPWTETTRRIAAVVMGLSSAVAEQS